MTPVAEKYRQRLIELRLDVERVQVYILENAHTEEPPAKKAQEASQAKSRLELAVLQ